MHFEYCAAEVMRHLAVGSGGQVLECDAGVAGVCGQDIPLSALKGLDSPLTGAQLRRTVEFFFDHRCDATIELAAWLVDPMTALLNEQGFERVAEEYVMACRTSHGPLEAELLEDADSWAFLLSHAFFGELTPLGMRLGKLLPALPNALRVGLRDGSVLAAGGQLSLHGAAALLAGDGTLAEYRGRGFQQRLIRDRLARAAALGADWAHAEVLPESGSYRNYERCGFTPAYSRIHFVRHFPAD